EVVVFVAVEARDFPLFHGAGAIGLVHVGAFVAGLANVDDLGAPIVKGGAGDGVLIHRRAPFPEFFVDDDGDGVGLEVGFVGGLDGEPHVAEADFGFADVVAVDDSGLLDARGQARGAVFEEAHGAALRVGVGLLLGGEIPVKILRPGEDDVRDRGVTQEGFGGLHASLNAVAADGVVAIGAQGFDVIGGEAQLPSEGVAGSVREDDVVLGPVGKVAAVRRG